MPKFRVYLAASVDGYSADSEGSVAWLDAFGSDDYRYEAFSAGINTVIMGRTPFDQTVSFDVPWPYAEKRSLVMTHRAPPDVSPNDVSFVSGSAEDIAAGLDDTDGDVWLMGGADVVGQFLDAGRVDSIEIFVMPILLGNGIPTFSLARSGPAPALELADSTRFDSGVVRLLYTTK